MQLSELGGSYWLLASLPIWVIATGLYFLAIGVLFIGRYWFEGFDYNISWSSQQGDVALIACVLIAAGILQSGITVPDVRIVRILRVLRILTGGAGGVIGGVALTGCLLGKLKKTVMDAYHDIVIVPMFVLLLGVSLPVVYLGGRTFEKGATAFFLSVWLVCLAYDWKTGRLNQRKYLASRHVSWI